MPTRLKVYPELRLVVSRNTGVFTPEDYLGLMLQLLSDPTFKSTFNHLVDCREITTLGITSRQQRTFGKNTAFSETSKRAFVVSTSMLQSMTGMLMTHREALERGAIRIFREMPEALAWLGLPPGFDAVANKDLGGDAKTETSGDGSAT
ncbi:MAG TPA: hypothetical protein VFJ90_13335 [Candidatus Didemnitutus sp.]|nr:hypothetical protein [Candidatus Didemnitutus sp.]